MLLLQWFLQFYFPKGPPPTKDIAEQCLYKIDQIFSSNPDGLPIHGILSLHW